MEEEKVEAHTLSLYPSDWDSLNKVARETGARSISGALRIILQEWRASRLVIRKAEEVDCVTAAN